MNQDNMINQSVNDDEITIDLTELFIALRAKIHIILLSGILMALLAFVGTKLFITPMYTSVTKLYVLSRQDSSSGVTYNELQSGAQLTKDYAELVTSRPILEQVIAVLNLDMEVKDLEGRITVDTPTDTRILRINVEDENPKKAKEIADVLREAVSNEITEIMHAESVDAIEDGSLPTEPSSPNFMRNMILGGMLGVLVSFVIVMWMFIRDDTIKTPDDVEQYLGLNVLTSIPIKENTKRGKKVKGLSANKAMKNMRR
ncbi:YveK family protein [[Clostridium] scindens]|uniref:YveK family protein n=2 Tax=Clostridium scindens (strain JCM 10418 / VPI 12708) TaxID=29347 RepID=UPI00157057A7|nr:Wzz/FepE/Etk N-terminal domain-containing protein [[Clostridium] scindens]NSI90212.1 protein-tyrosine kinase [[Clostridium] scindens]NSJ04785.1 protein-tyrosine kinase [[Clostridium] scindens]